jgi:hypothetical protein
VARRLICSCGHGVSFHRKLAGCVADAKPGGSPDYRKCPCIKQPHAVRREADECASARESTDTSSTSEKAHG